MPDRTRELVPTTDTNRLIWVALLVLGLGLLAACKPKEEANAKPPAKLEAIPVKTSPVEVAPVSKTLNANAHVEARREVVLLAESAGKIEVLHAEVGSAVEANTPLVEMSNPQLAIELRSAQSSATHLRRELDRVKPLADKGYVPSAQVGELRQQLDQANSAVARLRDSIKSLKVESPMPGVLARQDLTVGQQVTIGQEMAYVVDPSELEVEVHVPERALPQLSVGGRATVKSEALAGAATPATIRVIAPVVDPQSGTVAVTLTLHPDKTSPLRPGMFVTASLILDTRNDALIVPKRALVYEDNLTFVYQVSGDGEKRIAEKTRVKLGYTQDTSVEVVDGLKPGTQVVVVGQTGLKDGAKVNVVE